jgi:hypothetical protein
MDVISVEVGSDLIRVCIQTALEPSQRWVERGHPEYRVSVLNGEWFELVDGNGLQVRQQDADEHEGEGQRYLGFPRLPAFDLDSTLTMTSTRTRTVLTLPRPRPDV